MLIRGLSFERCQRHLFRLRASERTSNRSKPRSARERQRVESSQYRDPSRFPSTWRSCTMIRSVGFVELCRRGGFVCDAPRTQWLSDLAGANHQRRTECYGLIADVKTDGWPDCVDQVAYDFKVKARWLPA